MSSPAEDTISSDLIGHLTELRKRLIYVAGWFLASLGAGLYAAPKILTFVKSHLGSIEVEWSVFALSDGIAVYMKCALLVGIILTLPFLLYHLWAFARPGMTDAEAKSTLVYVPTSSLLFVCGVLFGYTVALPMMIRFMIKVNQSMGAQEVYGIQHYMSFLISFLLPMGVAFEMPLAMTFLTRIGLLTPDKMKQVRKYAYVGLAVVGTLISPPDFVSHLSVTVPLIILFEISAFISTRYYKRKLAVQTT
ncbi:twin-arginine translocase subunit TatC [Paenibacillus glycanilyticus]|uniref:Sec-independent protein translocase protein TatC n=1 Tax=Paenibacillus glycanilyticus TaxID=126569 RepID=A0ABQ6GI20_9BACL|nr:twin-arginine translocase subunit TatC [Paenibacillus glycanilyticus]GLX70453.1 Sec-independent protein translocase protein TatCy [Paenibacillus glycanilyticus]